MDKAVFGDIVEFNFGVKLLALRGKYKELKYFIGKDYQYDIQNLSQFN